MKTLADMTPQERAECVGMWVSYATPMGEHTAIYEMGSTLFEPGFGRFNRSLDTITPLLDLPRAWTMEGEPPAGDWEDDYTDSDGITLTTGEDLDVGPHQEVRRWVGEWEEI